MRGCGVMQQGVRSPSATCSVLRQSFPEPPNLLHAVGGLVQTQEPGLKSRDLSIFLRNLAKKTDEKIWSSGDIHPKYLDSAG